MFEELGLSPTQPCFPQRGQERDGGEGLRAERPRQPGPACGGTVLRAIELGPQLEDQVLTQPPSVGIQGGRSRRGKDGAPRSKRDRRGGHSHYSTIKKYGFHVLRVSASGITGPNEPISCAH